jgi:hypothetical protein
MAKFLFGWLERTQNRGGGATVNGKQDPRGNIALVNRLLEELENE